MKDLSKYAWPLTHLSEALETLAQYSGHRIQNKTTNQDDQKNVLENLSLFVETGAQALGIEAEPVEVIYSELKNYLKSAKSLILRFAKTEHDISLLTLLKCKHNKVILLLPNHQTTKIPIDEFCASLCFAQEDFILKECKFIFNSMDLTKKEQQKMSQIYLNERLGPWEIPDIWVLRPTPGSSFAHQMKQAGLFKATSAFITTYALQYFLWIFSWWIVGRGALQGTLDLGWLTAWAILLLTLVPLTMISQWMASLITIGAGSLLKRRLLTGALKLSPDETRKSGIGQFLSRVIESENLETLILTGGFLGIVAIIELLGSLFVLGLSGTGIGTTILLLLWVGLILFMGRRFYHKRFLWTNTRLEATHDLLEEILGHRTRLVQETKQEWFEKDDVLLENYFHSSKSMDKLTALLFAFAPRGWLLLSLLVLSPYFIFGQPDSTIVAVSLGGILMAYRALGKLSMSLNQMTDALVSWQQVKKLFSAAKHSDVTSSASLVAKVCSKTIKENDVLLRGQDIYFGYQNQAETVLNKCNITIRQGDKILFEGPSGSGKSTLAAILTGIYNMANGILLFHGLDRNTLGMNAWRKAIASAPQFHENHILTASFAFNLLMGRNWPPKTKDLEMAHEICMELGLGDLLSRMPAGFLQMLGETGWQLSHGEKSRLYVARALLQEPKVIILDESFAALDPDNLKQCIDAVLKRASTLLVIAHP